MQGIASQIRNAPRRIPAVCIPYVLCNWALGRFVISCMTMKTQHVLKPDLKTQSFAPLIHIYKPKTFCCQSRSANFANPLEETLSPCEARHQGRTTKLYKQTKPNSANCKPTSQCPNSGSKPHSAQQQPSPSNKSKPTRLDF